MLTIKRQNVNIAGHVYDYELEDGTLIHIDSWNGECYSARDNAGQEVTYTPVYRYEVEGAELTEDENSEEWDRQLEVVGFEEF